MLKPGTFARVHIESDKTDTVLTLPYSAMQYRYGVNRVFVVDGDKLSVRELKVGDRLGERIEILGGVKSGNASPSPTWTSSPTDRRSRRNRAEGWVLSVLAGDG